MFPKNRGTPKWTVYNGTPYLNGMIWGENPLFSETSIPFPNQHIGKEIFDPKKCVKNLQGEAGRGKVNFLVAGGNLAQTKKNGEEPPLLTSQGMVHSLPQNFSHFHSKIPPLRVELTATKASSWKNSRIFCLEFWREIFWGAKNPLRFSDSTWYCLAEILEETATRRLELLEPYGKANSWWLCWFYAVFVKKTNVVFYRCSTEKKSTLSMAHKKWYFHGPNWKPPPRQGKLPPAALVCWFFFQSHQKRCVSNGVGSKAHTLAMSPVFCRPVAHGFPTTKTMEPLLQTNV